MIVDVLHVVTLILVVLAMVPALAHALELPGKLRLPKETYFAVQPIYYPGFTIAGVSEPLAIISTSILLALTPRGGAEFWSTLAALVGLVAMHGVYWLFTHPVNSFWVRGKTPSRLGAGFFSLGTADNQSDPSTVDWTRLRDRWEYSHVARAGLAFLGFVTLAI
jgi:hypothetical protein